MFDGHLNLNFKKINDAAAFAKQMSKYFNKTNKYRKKILLCKKCSSYVKNTTIENTKKINDTIFNLQTKFKKDLYDPFKGVLEDPSLVINQLRQNRDDSLNILSSVDANKLCRKCKRWYAKMLNSYNIYKCFEMVQQNLKKEC